MCWTHKDWRIMASAELTSAEGVWHSTRACKVCIFSVTITNLNVN